MLFKGSLGVFTLKWNPQGLAVVKSLEVQIEVAMSTPQVDGKLFWTYSTTRCLHATHRKRLFWYPQKAYILFVMLLYSNCRSGIPFKRKYIISNWIMPADISLHSVSISQQTGIHEASLCFICARSIVFQHKIKILCWCWAHGVFSLFLAVLYIGFACVYFGFTLSSSTRWTQNGFKSVHREHENSLNTC